MTHDHMNSKEQRQNTVGAADNEPAGLPDLLKDLLKEAYPAPDGKIAEAVMARIRTEREASERAERAERRRRRQGLIMKWGGMAACMVILSGALVIASPLMNRGADTAVAAADQEAAEAYVLTDAASDGIAAYSGEEEGEETAIMTKSAPKEQKEETEPAPAVLYALQDYSLQPDGGEAGAADDQAKALADTEAETLEELSEQAVFGGDADNAAFLQSLYERNLLTPEVYEAWMTEMGYDAPEDWTAEQLCEAFGIALQP